MGKRHLYEDLIDRMHKALTDGCFFEASWYAYAVLEDRLISLIRSSTPKGTIQNIPQGMNKKLQILADRSLTDLPLPTFFDGPELDSWRIRRNDLAHAMAEGSLTIADVDIQSEALAKEGARLVGVYAAGAMRLKKKARRTR